MSGTNRRVKPSLSKSTAMNESSGRRSAPCRHGDLPRPAPLTPGSKFEAWTGSQIIEHRKRMRQLADAKAAADARRAKQVQPLAFRKKTKKVKLRAPAQRAQRVKASV